MPLRSSNGKDWFPALPFLLGLSRSHHQKIYDLASGLGIGDFYSSRNSSHPTGKGTFSHGSSSFIWWQANLGEVMDELRINTHNFNFCSSNFDLRRNRRKSLLVTLGARDDNNSDPSLIYAWLNKMQYVPVCALTKYETPFFATYRHGFLSSGLAHLTSSH